MTSHAGRPAFLISIDTEGDNAWARPRVASVRNAAFLPRFQALCERFGFKPTYLTNWEMASSPAFVDFARDLQRRGAAEIGMHLHAWDNPPIKPLTADDLFNQPYLIEYPTAVMEEKVARMTDLLETTFGTKMTSHRAGRWGFDARYAAILARRGYLVDCSVTPHVSWRDHPGDPAGRGGPDFTGFPDAAYRLDLDDISRAGAGRLIELPTTIVRQRPNVAMALARRVLGKSRHRVLWLRPNGRNLRDMLWVVDRVRAERRPYLQFTLHSSEFMPGGSPTFATEAAIEALYEHMETVFARIAQHFAGMTLTDYARTFEPSLPAA